MSTPNQLIIMADEWTIRALGCAGHSLVKTPNIDKLAARGTYFTKAYTPDPICVPARAAFQTGRYVHQIRLWSNAEPYTGAPTGWGHWLRDAGHRTVSVGKLHFRSSDDDNGFDTELLPLHVKNGRGWVPGLLRRDPLPFDASGFAGGVGRGGSEYSDYDRRICDRARQWIRDEGTNTEGTPWHLFVSFVSPHYPLNAPAAFFDLYKPNEIDMPFCYAKDERPDHPMIKALAEWSNYDKHFRDDAHVIEARQAYYGLCSYVDHLVGELLETLEDSGLTDTTRVIFTSDHGEMLGNHGIWTKMNMYEDSVGIPMIMAGPDVPVNKRVSTHVSLVDIAPTLMQGAGVAVPDDVDLPGASLLDIAAKANDQDRTIFSEYHDGGSENGVFMVRWADDFGDWKYVHYEGMFKPQLFNLEDDPEEYQNLATNSYFADMRREGQYRLSEFVDPEAVNDQALADQAAIIESYGGRDGIRDNPALHYDHTPISDETH